MEIIDASITSKIEVYNPIAAGIALMLQKHGAILTTPIIINGDAEKMAAAKEGRKELKKFRVSLEAKRKEEKAESLAYGRFVDSEAARIQAFATPLELAYDKSVTDEETRLDAIREAELQIEQKRIDGHRARIQGIKDVVTTGALCETSECIRELIDGMVTYLFCGFQEFQAEADLEYEKTCAALELMLAAKVKSEKQAADLKRQQEDLAQRKADFERQCDGIVVQAQIDAQKAALVVEVAQVIEVPAKTEALPEAATPSAQQLIQAVAEMFGVSMREARGWLVERAEEIQSV